MAQAKTRPAADAFRAAFQVEPNLARVVRGTQPVGLYRWATPDMEGFELPESDELVLALHLGGSRRVRAVTEAGLSDTRSMPGRLTILPPGQRAAFRTEGSVSVATLHLPATVTVTVPSAPADPTPALARFARRDGYARATIEALLQAARAGIPLTADYPRALTEALLSHLAHAPLLDADPAEPPSPDLTAWLGRCRLDALCRHIDEHLDRKLGIDDLARLAGLGRSRFTQIFRERVGLSPHQYLIRRRVEAAKHLLVRTDYPLAYIAQQTGFPSQSHFAASFRSSTGDTPLRFRQTSR